MSDITAKAQMLQTVEAHEERFLGLWVLDCLIEERGFFDKLTLDLTSDPGDPSSHPDGWSINL